LLPETSLFPSRLLRFARNDNQGAVIARSPRVAAPRRPRTGSATKQSREEGLREPALPSAVMLGVAIGFAGAGLVEPEIEFLDVGILPQAVGRAFEHDAAVFHHIAVVGDVERQRRVLLYEEDRQLLLLLQSEDHAEDFLDDHRREAQR